MEIRNLRVGDFCLNLSAIQYAQRFTDGVIVVHFRNGERIDICEESAEKFWQFYTSVICGTKNLS